MSVSTGGPREVSRALGSDSGAETVGGRSRHGEEGTVFGIDLDEGMLGSLKLGQPVHVEHKCPWIFGVHGETKGRLGVCPLVEGPLLFGVSSLQCFGELQVGFDPGDGGDTVNLGGDEKPEVSVGAAGDEALLELEESVVDIPAVREDVQCAREVSESRSYGGDFASLGGLLASE